MHAYRYAFLSTLYPLVYTGKSVISQLLEDAQQHNWTSAAYVWCDHRSGRNFHGKEGRIHLDTNHHETAIVLLLTRRMQAMRQDPFFSIHSILSSSTLILLLLLRFSNNLTSSFILAPVTGRVINGNDSSNAIVYSAAESVVWTWLYNINR